MEQLFDLAATAFAWLVESGVGRWLVGFAAVCVVLLGMGWIALKVVAALSRQALVLSYSTSMRFFFSWRPSLRCSMAGGGG